MMSLIELASTLKILFGAQMILLIVLPSTFRLRLLREVVA